MSVFHNINRYAIGFDHLMDHLVSLHSNNNLTTNEYPPYDIIKEGESNYKIELAVAGFKKDELSIQLKDNTLTIKGESNSKNSNGDYLHKNIARRSFSKDFTNLNVSLLMLLLKPPHRPLSALTGTII